MQRNTLKKQEEINLKSNASRYIIYSFYSFKQSYTNYQEIVGRFENQVWDIVYFLTQQAEEFDKRNISKTFLYLDEDNQEIVGFFTLKIKGLLTEKLCLSTELLKKLSGGYANNADTNILNFYLIGQLGVAKKYQGQKFGKQLLVTAIDLICESQDNVGGRYILVDAIKDKRVLDFYKKFGFAELQNIESEETITMIAPIKGFVF